MFTNRPNRRSIIWPDVDILAAWRRRRVSAMRIDPVRLAASAQTDSGWSLAKSMSRSIPGSKGGRTLAIFGEAEKPKFGIAEAQVGEAEQSVAIVMEFGREPDRRAHRIEEFDDGRGVGSRRTALFGGLARDGVGAQLRAQRGSEGAHAAILSAAGRVTAWGSTAWDWAGGVVRASSQSAACWRGWRRG